MGKKTVYLPECRSTNDEAASMIARGLAEDGLAVVAGAQTAGKGQRGNSWESEPGRNITLSIVIHSGFLDPSENFMLTVIASLGLCDLLSEYLPDGEPRIKWPNDIMTLEGKLAGILIENFIRGHRMEWTVIGLGINVNQRIFSTPGAVSLARICGQEFGHDELLKLLFHHFENRLRALRRGLTGTLMSDYHRRMYWLGETRRFEVGDREIEGRIEGVDDLGKLRLRVETNLRVFDFKQIRFLH